MVDHIANRDAILRALHQELVGPCPRGEEIDCTQDIHLDDAEAAYCPYRQRGSGEEILQRDSPTKRYGVGVLYPMDTKIDPEEVEAQIPPPEIEEGLINRQGTLEPLTETAACDCEKIAARVERRLPETDSDDFDLVSANAYKPSSMAVSLLVRLPIGTELTVEATGGRYAQKSVMLIGREREWWLRSPVRLSSRFQRVNFPTGIANYVKAYEYTRENCENLDLQIELFARPYGSISDEFLITVCLVNRKQSDEKFDLYALFQCHFDVKIQPENSRGRILPYPTAEPRDSEELSQELLYRDKLIFAVGHGCAADWEYSKTRNNAVRVSAECLPVFETPSTTPDILSSNGQPLVASMRLLAGIDEENDGFSELDAIISEYENWIAKQERRISGLCNRLQDTAHSHMRQCSEVAFRMRNGLTLLRNDPQIKRAFQFANLAMLIQQLRARRESRSALFDLKKATLFFEEEYLTLDLNSKQARECQWRAFQIAFILASLPSTADTGHEDRKRVELIWFPTGGGKTEAYFGLASFSIFLRRLRNPSDKGVQALMRYTLRLLTAQQFQRASRLVCAMEYVRRQNASVLGNDFISIGIWLGGSTTPNTRVEAKATFRSLLKGDGAKENKFVLDRCPWCGAEMGPVNLVRGKGRRQKIIPRVIGYEQRNNTIIYHCPDRQCEFHKYLPLYVIDDDIYEICPDIIIGTVDKFAMLAWRTQARSLFGISSDGTRKHSPPGLIIQDELHLISGPVGSMVGLYEPIIEELCTDRRGGQSARSKIICSTATIRSYSEQVQGLYARERTSLFPPPGLDADDSFFARVARQADGSLERGRIYVGVHAPGLGSLQTVQVRTFASLLQAPQPFSPAERDPWWTLLLFFNSLRGKCQQS